MENVMEAVREERNRIRVILEYILNKNSKPISEGGMNFPQMLKDLEELERELLD